MFTIFSQDQLHFTQQTLPELILEPKQVDKTTFALALAELIQKKAKYLDLESDADLVKLTDSEAYLKRFENELLIVDEVQRKPDLGSVIKSPVYSIRLL